MESRQLLSTAGSSTIITPNLEVAAVSSSIVGTSSLTNPTPASTALTPALLDVAYGINRAWTSGAGETIAIVDAYDDPNIVSDLAQFDSYYKLPAASLTVENQFGQTTNLPATSSDWSLEIALDVEWAHTAAPGAKIILVEANSASTSDLMAAVKTAANQASVVSMSWGGSEFQGETQYDSAAYFGNSKVTFVAASGDDGGAAGAEWPAVSPNVVSVGGTTLTLTSSWSIASQTAWSASGTFWSGFSGSTGGTSLYEPEPSYQVSTLGNTGTRATPDVASVANPSTGLSVYNTVAGSGQTGWFQVGGTSAGAPVWAGIIADADQARAAVGKASLSSTQTLNLLYGLYASGSYYNDFYDVTSGSNFAGGAGWGYDLVTGLGSAYASKVVTASATYTVTSTKLKASAVTTVTGSATKATAQAVASTMVAAASSQTNVTNAVALSATAVVTQAIQAQPVSNGSSGVAVSSAATTASGPALVIQSLVPRAQSVIVLSRPAVAMAAEPRNESGPHVEPVPPLDRISEISTTAMASVWERAIEANMRSWDEVNSVPSSPAPAPAKDLEELVAGPNPLLLIGGSVGAWAAWMYGSRRVEEKGRWKSPLVFQLRLL